MSNRPVPDGSAAWRNVDANSAGATHYLDVLTRELDVFKQRGIDLLALSPGMSVLEVGCGIGRDAEALAARVGPAGRVIAAGTVSRSGAPPAIRP